VLEDRSSVRLCEKCRLMTWLSASQNVPKGPLERTFRKDLNQPLQRKQGFSADSFYGRARCSPMLGANPKDLKANVEGRGVRL